MQDVKFQVKVSWTWEAFQRIRSTKSAILLLFFKNDIRPLFGYEFTESIMQQGRDVCDDVQHKGARTMYVDSSFPVATW
jgi:hypothetical protein